MTSIICYFGSERMHNILTDRPKAPLAPKRKDGALFLATSVFVWFMLAFVLCVIFPTSSLPFFLAKRKNGTMSTGAAGEGTWTAYRVVPRT